MAAACSLALAAGVLPGEARAQAAASQVSPTNNPANNPTNKKTGTQTASASGKAKVASARTSGKKKTSRKKTTARGQQKIDPERAHAIQEALIREHYLTGEAAGTWNQVSEDAMRKYQADHGWQSKTVPDARALISLGLGPNHDHLLNPESAMTTGPDNSHAASVSSTTPSPVSHSADPGRTTIPALPAPATTPGHDSPQPQ